MSNIICCSLFALLCFLIISVSSQQTCAAPEAKQCDSITCGFDIQSSFDFNNTACRFCSQDDIGARFTSCNNGVKNLFYFWRPPATCRQNPQNPISLPSPVTVPCNFSCSASEVFNFVSGNCTSCPPGTSSASSLLRVTDFSAFLPGFRTYCEREVFGRQGCNPWRLQGSFIDSGDNRNNNYIRSIVTYDFEVATNNASLSFEYIVDAERGYDFFGFMINWRLFIARSFVSQWTRYQHNFTSPGFYTATFMYYKDQLLSTGADMARVRNIELSGAQSFGTVCRSCLPGTFSSSSTTGCQPCPAGTFSDVERSTICKDCPSEFSSFSGSSFCFRSSFPCTVNDYAFSFGSCVNGFQNRSAQWITPTICNISQSVIQLPPTTLVACAPCKPGQRLVNNICEYCPEGQSSSDGSTCTPCSASNQVPGDKVFYVPFNSRVFSTSCTGECRSPWRFAETGIDSGVGNGFADSVLEYIAPVSPLRNSIMSIIYTLSCPSNGSVDFLINGVLTTSAQCLGCEPILTTTNLVLGLQQNATNVRIVYKSRVRTFNPADAYSCNIMRIQNITITGSSVGAATNCINCPSGTYNDGGLNCIDCAPGTFQSQSQQSNCTSCPVNTFSALARSSSCLPCGNGTSTKGLVSQTSCVWDYAPCATLTTDGRVFNWSSIAAAYWNTGFPDPDGGDSRIYLNLCRSPNHPFCKSIMCRVPRVGEIVELGGQYSVTPIGSSTGVRLALVNLQNGCSTNIEMLCRTNIEQRETDPTILRETGCRYRVTLYKDAACPSCLSDDYIPFQGSCINNQRLEGYYKRITCYGGAPSPAPTKSVSCSYEVAFPYWVIAIIVVLALIIVLTFSITLICLCVRNRRLYQQLQDKPASEQPQPRESIETAL